MKKRILGILKRQNGITGLETAIVLVAFVMVASVFSYVVLTAGLFSSQKAKEAVNSGLQQTCATVELKGNVIARMVDGFATELYVTVGIVPGGTSVDFTDTSAGENKVLVSYSDSFNQYPSLDWTMEIVNSNNGDSVVDAGEFCYMTIDLADVNAGAASDAEKLGPYRTFIIEIKPPDGAILTIQRTLPARVTQLVNLN